VALISGVYFLTHAVDVCVCVCPYYVIDSFLPHSLLNRLACGHGNLCYSVFCEVHTMANGTFEYRMRFLWALCVFSVKRVPR